jgi:hypothetical protein
VRHRILTAILATGVVLGAAIATSALLAWTGAFGPDRHEDGAGPLQSSPGTTERIQMGPDRPGAEWSYGMFICTTTPDDPPVLLDVAVTGPVEGSAFLGARYLSDPLAAGDMMASARGFPPTSLDAGAMAGVARGSVVAECGRARLPAQLILGLRLTGDGDGGFSGEEIAYTQGGRRHVLLLHNVFMFCGPNTLGLDACIPPGERPAGG